MHRNRLMIDEWKAVHLRSESKRRSILRPTLLRNRSNKRSKLDADYRNT